MTLGTNNLFVELTTEWEQLFGSWNWYTFTLISLSFENDKWTGGVEASVCLLGFWARLRWNYKPEILEEMSKEDVGT